MDLQKGQKSQKRRFQQLHLLIDTSFDENNFVQELLSSVGRLTVTVERAEGLSKEWMDAAMSSLDR